MPSLSGVFYDVHLAGQGNGHDRGFYALVVGRVLRHHSRIARSSVGPHVSMPSLSGVFYDRTCVTPKSPLGYGFLCPRCRACFTTGSQETSRLTCGNIALCERQARAGIVRCLYLVVNMRIRPLTCVRALPGMWL